MPDIFLSAEYITRRLGENDDVFEARDRDFLHPQNPTFWSFWQTRFLAKQKFHRRRDIFARWQAKRLSFGRQHPQVSNVETPDLLLSTPYVTRNLDGEEHGLFVVDEDFLSYVRGMHVVVFTRSSSVLLPGLWPPHQSAVAYCNTLKGPSQAPTREPQIHGCAWCLLFSARPCFKVYAYE